MDHEIGWANMVSKKIFLSQCLVLMIYANYCHVNKATPKVQEQYISEFLNVTLFPATTGD